jgi:plastocyanin
VLVPKGEKLLLVDDDSVEHIIQNGSWTQNGTPQSREEPRAPVVRNRDIKGGSATIGPFTTAGVFHLYCTIHRGMNLTIVVQ